MMNDYVLPCGGPVWWQQTAAGKRESERKLRSYSFLVP